MIEETKSAIMVEKMSKLILVQVKENCHIH